jgi:hypothetical protein
MKWYGSILMCFVLFACDGSRPPADHPADAATIARHNEAVAAMGAFQYETAMVILAELTTKHPWWNDAQVDHAIAQLNRQAQGDDEAAIARLAIVLERSPHHQRAHFTSGILRLHAGKLDAAAAHFEKVVNLDSADAYAAYYLGQVRMQQGDIPGAVQLFTQAIAIDPYLRSAYYAGSQAARRGGDAEQGQDWLDVFQRMEHNPRARLAEIKYTRMGPKAEVVAMDAGDQAPPLLPVGPIFDRESMSVNDCRGCPPFQAIGLGWIGDGQSLVLMSHAFGSELYRWSAAGGLVQINDESGLTAVADVNATLWGDVNGDGHLDVVLLRSGENELWLGQGSAAFERTSAFDVGTPGRSVDGAMFDADHDGDLDVFVVNDKGAPCELLNNDGDGSWRSVLDESSGFPGKAQNSREVVVADFDGDLDIDVLVINQRPPHMVWLNDRLWNWTQGSAAWNDLLAADIAAAVAVDLDADGAMDVVTLDQAYGVNVWRRESQSWEASVVAVGAATPPLLRAGVNLERSTARPRGLSIADVTGNGLLNVIRESGWAVANHTGRPSVLDVLSSSGELLQSFQGDLHWALVHGVRGAGPMMMCAGANGGIGTIPAGSGRFPFVDIVLAGRTSPAQSMRSNVSGIGAAVAARLGDRWTMAGVVRSAAGPGQNLQPLSIGLAGRDEVDFVLIDWSDGVVQTEPHLKPGVVHVISETQRQLSSCPVIFAWDGSQMRFLTDCLGVGGMGFMLDPSTYAKPRPVERVLLPRDVLAPRDGQFEVILAEPMQETCYLDAVVLETIDLPSGWEVLADERMGTSDPMPTSDLLFARASMSPIAATNGRGADVLAEVIAVDAVAVSPGVIDGRFIGRVVEPFVLEFEFASPIADLPGRPILVIDGWVEYPYSQTMFAAWQAGLSYSPVSIEARSCDGTWKMLHVDIGYPAGMPRTSVFPLDGLSQDVTAIRIQTDIELYVDAARVVGIEPCPAARTHRSAVAAATLEQVGYPRRIHHEQRRPEYDWSDRTPFWDTRTQWGEYTRFGDVRPVVAAVGDGVAVFGAGEAVRLRFDPLAPVADGWTRTHVLDVRGWCKDMDLMTGQGETVEPVPGDGGGEHLRTRHRSGR